MNKANIKDNIPYCSVCGSPLKSATTDYKLVEYEGKKYTEFVKRCTNKKCGTLNQYLCEISMSKHRRFVADETDMKEIQEEKK